MDIAPLVAQVIRERSLHLQSGLLPHHIELSFLRRASAFGDLPELDWQSMPAWIATIAARHPPAIIKVSPAPDGKIKDFLAPSNIGFDRHPDSGLLEIHLPKDQEPRELHSRFTDIFSLASALDPKRDIVSSPQDVTQTIRAEATTLIGGWPVVGPGGRLTFYETAKKLHVDVVVRNRIDEIASSWRTAEAIEQDLRTKMAAQGEIDETAKLYGEFGYFELSKFETQNWLRPAFVFVVRRTAEVEGAPLPAEHEDAPAGPRRVTVNWHDTIAVAATTSDEVPLDEGLGSWT